VSKIARGAVLAMEPACRGGPSTVGEAGIGVIVPLCTDALIKKTDSNII